MSYTREQKREALAHKQLWWRYPNAAGNYAKSWSLVTDDLKEICHQDLEDEEAEYHIGPTAPTPPRVLSELEGELLEALKGLDEAYCRCMEPLTRDERTEDRKRLIAARAAIQKAEAQQ